MYINDDIEALKGDTKALKVLEEALKGDREVGALKGDDNKLKGDRKALNIN